MKVINFEEKLLVLKQDYHLHGKFFRCTYTCKPVNDEWFYIYEQNWLVFFVTPCTYKPFDHHHHHHLFSKRPSIPCLARVRCLPHVCSPSTYPWILPIWAATLPKQFHSIFQTLSPSLPAPAHTSHPTTTTFLQADTHSFIPLCSKCPNHLNLPCLITSATLWTLRRLYKTTRVFSVLQRHSTHTSHQWAYALLSLDYADFQRNHRPSLRIRIDMGNEGWKSAWDCMINQPEYLADLIHYHQPRRQLQAASNRLLEWIQQWTYGIFYYYYYYYLWFFNFWDLKVNNQIFCGVDSHSFVS